MADTSKDGGPVYPCKITPSIHDIRALREAGNLGLLQARDLAANHTGMSLRDAAALAALQSILARCFLPDALDQDLSDYADDAARLAWSAADAFMAAREAKTE